ncbi:3D domain-containing protein [Hungatella sp.]|uniref:3D domain-containing protein n=1 Tax=Hungatella sp. TaxID=2613924 RepID=UPI002A80D86F|nr:3D domain-containing protein [Hungatella sp.]
MKKAVIFLSVILLSALTTLTGFCSFSADRTYGKEIKGRPEAAPKESSGGGDVLYIKTERETVEAESDPEPEYAGEFSVAAYCGCESCCGSGQEVQTYFGTQLTANHTIAADFQLFSPGEKLLIEGICYTVEDRTLSSSSASLLIYFDSHSDAVEFGRKTLKVYRIPEEEADVEGEALGEFIITGYCGCEVCTGIYSTDHMTFTGVEPLPEHTIAADPNLIPIHSKLLINGIVYTVEDTGKNITGRRLDIYFESHEEAVIYGRKEEKVYLVEKPGQGE